MNVAEFDAHDTRTNATSALDYSGKLIEALNDVQFIEYVLFANRCDSPLIWCDRFEI